LEDGCEFVIGKDAEMAVACFKLMPQYLLEETEEEHYESQKLVFGSVIRFPACK
jgi:hypothetical protein